MVDMAVTEQRASVCHFVSYIMLFQKSIVYNIPAGGEEGLLAYSDLMSFELYFLHTFHFDTDVSFSFIDIILKLK